MAWAKGSSDEDKRDNPFLDFGQIDKVDDYRDKTVRVLEKEPETAWQHWAGQRSYNCPGGQCPVCIQRKAAIEALGKKEAQEKFPLRSRSFFNVLDLEKGEVKVFGFGYGFSRDLLELEQEEGDLRSYDIVVRKRKTGPLAQNITYKVFKKRAYDLSPEQQAQAEQRHDLEEFTKAASPEDLAVVAKGGTPEQKPAEQQLGFKEPLTPTPDGLKEGYPIATLSENPTNSENATKLLQKLADTTVNIETATTPVVTEEKDKNVVWREFALAAQKRDMPIEVTGMTPESPIEMLEMLTQALNDGK